MNRRELFPLAAAALLTGWAGYDGGRKETPKRGQRSAVTLARSLSGADLVELIRQQVAGLQPGGRRVLLKPDLGVSGQAPLLAAAVAAFTELGAAEIKIGDAPEFNRDALALAEASGFPQQIPNFYDAFVDLSGDDVVPLAGIVARADVYLPETAARADLVVVLANLQAGALSLANLPRLLPGSVYGWPRTGVPGTAQLARMFSQSFTLIDGGGVLAMGRDLAAVDATCLRLLGLDPRQDAGLAAVADRTGVIDQDRIDIAGESLESARLLVRRAA